MRRKKQNLSFFHSRTDIPFGFQMNFRLPQLKALKHRNFRFFIGGQTLALIGYWMQNIALSWWLYKTTHSASLLGLLAFASSLPILLLSPLAGLWSDRCNLYKAMFATQALEMLQAVTLASLALTGLLQPWHVIFLSMLMGVMVAVELPIRHAFLLELVEQKKDLPNAIAVTSLMANCGRLVGPALAGLVIGWFSESACFVINALSFSGVIVSFFFIHVTPTIRTITPQPFFKGLCEGFSYVYQSYPMRSLLLLLVAMGLLANPYVSLMPVLVSEVFHGDAHQMGFMVGASGMGAVAGTLYLAMRTSVRGLIKLLTVASMVAGIALALLPHLHWVWLCLPFLSFIGFGILVPSVSVNMILQTIVDDDKRGRAMSLYTVSFMGVAPFGALAQGVLVDHIGVAATLTIAGLGSALCAGLLALQQKRIRGELSVYYDRLGVAQAPTKDPP